MRARALCAAAGALCHWSYAPSVARHAPKEVVERNTAPKPWEEEAKAATRLAKLKRDGMPTLTKPPVENTGYALHHGGGGNGKGNKKKGRRCPRGHRIC